MYKPKNTNITQNKICLEYMMYPGCTFYVIMVASG